ncbi:MAG: hypothetical protein J6J81_01820 [Oscillospiraceae bacterium]|nr:hypothetical protein [Oscillospiraceae bacterium]
MRLARRIAKAFGGRAPAIQYELKQSVALAMEDPEIAKLFDRYPTPDQFYKKMTMLYNEELMRQRREEQEQEQEAAP